jgi:prophage maintenance system killer protein
MPKPIPDKELQAIEAIVGRHPEGIGVGSLGRELGHDLSRRTLQYRLKYLVDRHRLIREGDRRWASYRLPTHEPAGTREDKGRYRVGGTGDGGDVVVYEAPNGDVSVDVRLDGETVWLTQQQMAKLFGRERSVVAKHIRSAFREGELDSAATCAKFAQVQVEGGRRVSRRVDHFNLDVIISVGYRVKSVGGTHFRIWATRTLREHLVRGYTLNERRLAERGLDEARQTLDLLARTLENHALVDDTGRAVLELVTRYADTWRLLLEYDENRLALPSDGQPSAGVLDLEQATHAIEELKRQLTNRNGASSLFGKSRDDMLAGILGSIEQTMFGEPLYGSVKEKAAHLLYFIVKDHPFTDGNKRIGAFLFVLYLRQEGLVHSLNPAGLTALTLLIAESAPSSKDLMIRLIVNLLR